MNAALNVGIPVGFSNDDQEISIRVPCRTDLDYVYYAVARSVLGQTEILFEHTLYGKWSRDFEIILPNQAGNWSVFVHGYLNRDHVLEWSKSMHQIFKSKLYLNKMSV